MSEQESQDTVVKPIGWMFPEDLVSRYATRIVVQHEKHEFVISFFELQHPPLLGSPEEARALLEKMEFVPAKCVARVVVSPSRIQGFIDALQKNYAKYQEKYGTPEE